MNVEERKVWNYILRAWSGAVAKLKARVYGVCGGNSNDSELQHFPIDCHMAICYHFPPLFRSFINGFPEGPESPSGIHRLYTAQQTTVQVIIPLIVCNSAPNKQASARVILALHIKEPLIV